MAEAKSGSSSIMEQWVTCYNLRDSPARDINNSVYTVIFFFFFFFFFKQPKSLLHKQDYTNVQR